MGHVVKLIVLGIACLGAHVRFVYGYACLYVYGYVCLYVYRYACLGVRVQLRLLGGTCTVCVQLCLLVRVRLHLLIHLRLCLLGGTFAVMPASIRTTCGRVIMQTGLGYTHCVLGPYAGCGALTVMQLWVHAFHTWPLCRSWGVNYYTDVGARIAYLALMLVMGGQRLSRCG